MPPEITEDLFNRYVQGTAAPAEAAAVRAWLAQPANQLLAQYWMRQHWDALAAGQVSAAPAAAEEPDYEALLVRLHAQLAQQAAETARHPAPRVARRGLRWPKWVAAAAVAAALGGGWLRLHAPRPAASPLEYRTAYGQTRTVALPDGSQVTLNGHSRLRYAAAWAPGQPREVWLDGEAYFSVQHQPDHQRFLVHTHGGPNVEVLGTQFTVYRRHEQARVVLLSGKVRVDFAGQRPDVVMRPGELVETRDAQPEAVVHRAVRTTAPYAAWKDAKLVLDETPIAELATRLQDTYGVQVVVRTPALGRRKVSGTVPVRDLDVLLQALAETCHLQASRQPGRIVLSDQP